MGCSIPSHGAAAGTPGGSTRDSFQIRLRGWLRGKIDEWSEDTLYNVCRGLRLTDDDNSGNAIVGIATAVSSTGLLVCTRCALLALVLLYHHSARNSDAAVLGQRQYTPPSGYCGTLTPYHPRCPTMGMTIWRC